MTYTNHSDGNALSESTLDANNAIALKLGVLYDNITNFPRYSHTFSTDEATTSTNFTYDSTDDTYTVIGTSAGTLIMPYDEIKLGDFNPSFDFPSYGFIKWKYVIGTVIDECNDSSFDTGTMTAVAEGTTVGTVSEDTAKATHTKALSSGSEKIGIRTVDSIADGETFLISFTFTSTDTSQKKYLLRVNDGTNFVELDSYSEGAMGTHKYVIKRVGNLLYVWRDGTPATVGADSPYDISALSTVMIEGWAFGIGANTATLDVNYIRKVDGTETTTVSEFLSVDNGSNYVTADSNGYCVLSANKGFKAKMKLTTTPVSGEFVEVSRADCVILNEDD